jgi:hypothetical protein
MSLIIIDLDSFDKVILRRRNIDRLSGVWFVDPKIKVGLEFMTSRLRIRSYWVNDFFKLLTEDGV